MEVKKMKSTFRVVHIIGGGEFGGAEDHIINLLQQLRYENIHGEVICFYDSKFAKFLRELGIPVEVLSYGRFDIRLLSALEKSLKEKKPDIVHTHGVKANFFGRLAAKRLNIFPVITTIHSILKYDYRHPVAYRLAKLLEDSTRKSTDCFIAISNNMKDLLIEEGISASKIELIYHGIDVDKYAPKKDDHAISLAKQWGKTENTFLVGAIGRLQSVKGFDYFIRACSNLYKENPDLYRFVLVGDGPEKSDLEKLVAKEGLREVFQFAGFRDDIDSCLRALDCFVCSSHSEGLPLSVMEALATGVPVVTTYVGGIRDLVKHGKNGYAVEPRNVDQLAEAIGKVYSDSETTRKLTAQAREDMISNFSLSSMGKNTAEVYRKWLK